MIKCYAVVTEKNCEELCVKELRERFKIKSEPKKGFVEFEAKNEDVLKVTYFSQTAKRILLKIGSGSFKDFEDLLSKIEKDLQSDSWHYLLDEKYRVNCERRGVHDFNSVVVEQEVSSIIKKTLKEKSVADYNTKDLVFFVDIEDDDYLFGVDYAGKDLSKRNYLFFNNPIAIKGTLAFNLLMFSDFKPKKTLLDCFALAGVIPIEAAIYEKNSSVHFFSKDFFFPKKIKAENEELLKNFDLEIKDEKFNNVFSCDSSFPNLAAQKKNSRIAGVEKSISFSRTDTKNLDIKNFSKEIDMVCTRIIEPSKKVNEKVAERAYEDLFLATKEFLKKGGTINVVVRNPFLLEETAEKNGFIVKEKLETTQGQQEFFFVKLSRN